MIETPSLRSVRQRSFLSLRLCRRPGGHFLKAGLRTHARCDPIGRFPFDRPKRGCKNLDQPARSHCVRGAVWDAAPRKARERVSTRKRANRDAVPVFSCPTSSRVDETLALSSMWPIALATTNGRPPAACRPPVVGWGSLCGKTSSLCGRLDESTLLIPLFSAATLSGGSLLTGQKGTEKAAPTGTSSLRSRRRLRRRTAKGPEEESGENGRRAGRR